MKIKIWGCRGSIPSPGCDTSVYGGNTTCVEVRPQDGSLIVIDAGTGLRCLGNALLQTGEPKKIHLLLTHAHWDHLQGFPFFVPAYTEGYSILVRGGPLAQQSLEAFLAHQLDPPYFPVPFRDLKAVFDFQQENGRSLTAFVLSGRRMAGRHALVQVSPLKSSIYSSPEYFQSCPPQTCQILAGTAVKGV